jgi:hypothetical protein
MATPRKTTTRKTTTKRGPTKAAALKALGLTAEDLEVIKSLREGVEAAKKFDGADAETSAIEVAMASHAEQKAAARETLGISPGPSLADQINTAREEAIEAEAKKAGTTPGPGFYIRNLRHVDVGFRLESQEGQGKKRTDLKPRGQRGDLKKISNKDLNDSGLLNQVEIGLVEIITEHEAREVISKQSTNAARAPHPAMAGLRNELDQPYAEGALKVEASFEDQGVVVAHLNPQGGGAGELPNRGRGGIDWEAARGGVQQNAPVGGNPSIISDGFAADAIARRKDLEGPAAGLGGVKVTLGETKVVE